MKNKLVLALACVVLVAGCATDNNGGNGDNNSQAAKNKQSSEKKPELGMTKDEIIGMYGKTDNIQSSSEGETWVYNMNMGEAFIPFNFGYRAKMRIITFDKDGKVVRWNYSN